VSAGTRVQAAIARLGRWTGRADVRRALLGPAAQDLSPTDAWVLGVLAAVAPLRASAPAEMQDIDRFTVTAQVRHLERAGLVAREPDSLATLLDRLTLGLPGTMPASDVAAKRDGEARTVFQ
jgi:DNA-binding MarR family transcriptional regulator